MSDTLRWDVLITARVRYISVVMENQKGALEGPKGILNPVLKYCSHEHNKLTETEAGFPPSHSSDVRYCVFA